MVATLGWVALVVGVVGYVVGLRWSRRDAEGHLPDCSGRGKVRIGTTNE